MLKRVFSTFTSNNSKHALGFKDRLKVQSWQVHDYGEIQNLRLELSRIPIIRNPNEVLIQVIAASINPIDLLMLRGYGRTLMQIPRMRQMELPLTLGRDFSGIVIDKGLNVKDNFQIGDEVYGFIPIHKQGSFGQTLLADSCHILPKPKHLTHTQSTSLVYAAMTAWSALFIFGNLLMKQTKGLRVLILGASGGVGTIAVQLLKSQGCTVFATCAEDAAPLVSKLGADCVFNYKDKDFEKNVELEGRYHVILDGAKTGIQNIPKGWKFDTYVTLNSPLLTNTDNHGLVSGLMQSACNLIDSNLSRFQARSSVRWGFFLPSHDGFKFLDDLIAKDKIKPVIHKTFNFEQLLEALQTMSQGHLRGKIVVDYK